MVMLKDSGVVFDEVKHTYHLDGKQLSGITGMLERQLFPSEYNNVSQEVLDAKAEFGHAIHGDIELFDSGIDMQNEYTEQYRAIKNVYGLTTIANEYLVTDSENFASAIDIVVEKDDDGIWLVDTKTVYTLNHEKVAWQLSIYKYMFELQNPGLEVKGIACLWFKVRKGELKDTEFIDLTQMLRSVDEVRKLLESEVTGTQYVDASKTEMVVPVNVQNEICRLELTIKELTEKQKQLREGLLKTMQEKGIKSFKSDKLLLTRKLATTTTRFDSKAFAKDYPELYEQYKKETQVSESITIKVYED